MAESPHNPLDPEQHEDESPTRRRIRLIGLFAGPALGLLAALALPDAYAAAGGMVAALGFDAKVTAGLAVWMAIWWMTESIPVYATALLPLAVLPATGAVPIDKVAPNYAKDLIFLFMGGFMLALGMQRWGLHRRIALTALRLSGTGPRRVVGGFMVITALLSMWVSNTATTLMMMPIAASVAELFDTDDSGESAPGCGFGVCLLLGIAYAASIGGLGTMIGSPPNLVAVSYLQKNLGIEITFAQWMMVGVPIVAVFLPIAWFLLTGILYPIKRARLTGGAGFFKEQLAKLGPVKPGERAVFVVFLAAAAAWIFRAQLAAVEFGGSKPFAGLTDSGIAVIAAVVLFVIPVDRRGAAFALNWQWASRIPWGLLILFGGGLALAGAIGSTGLSAFLGSSFGALRGIPVPVLVLLAVALVIFLTELTSNTATATTFVPILAAVAAGLGAKPVLLLIPCALAATCAFMLPVATPPNAIVFGTGRVTVPQMIRAGIWLNLIGIALLTAAAYALVLPLLGGLGPAAE